MKSLSIVIPAFNEEPSIGRVVAEALQVGAQACSGPLEVLVCDDGSVDGTAAAVAHAAAADQRVRLLRHRRNQGIDATIRTLYAEASHQHVFLISADRQWPMESLIDMAQALERGADLVVGVRTDKAAVYTAYRRLLSYGYERVVRALGSPVGDPGSIKLGRTDVLRIPVSSRGVFAEGERLIRAARAGHLVVGCPVRFERRRAGKALGARPKVVARALADVARVAASLSVGWPRPCPPKASSDRDPDAKP